MNNIKIPIYKSKEFVTFEQYLKKKNMWDEINMLIDAITVERKNAIQETKDFCRMIYKRR